MKFGIVADTHLGQYWRTYPSRAKKLIDTLRNNLLNIRNYSENLMILGDFYHSANLPPDCMSYIQDNIFDVFEKFSKVFLVVGNHEVFLNYANVQKSIPGMILSDKISVFEQYGVSLFKIRGDKSSCNYFTLPYNKDLESYISEYGKNNSDDIMKNGKGSSVLFGHFTPKEIFERMKISVEPLVKNIDGLNKIFLGDYHDPKSVMVGNCEVVSIGSTYYWDISDIFKKREKRFIVFDSDDMTYESYKLNLPKINYIQIDENNKDMLNFDNKNEIYFITSSIPLDFTQWIVDGYDIYFNYLPDNKVSMIMEGVEIDTVDFVNVEDSWQKYLQIQNVDSNIKEIANTIFNKRDNLNSDFILSIL